jgi:hypothetical protein
MSSDKELCRFAAACARLYFNLAGPFEQVDVLLCEDHQTVSLMAYDASGEFATASYLLDEQVGADFDLSEVKAAFDCNTNTDHLGVRPANEDREL